MYIENLDEIENALSVEAVLEIIQPDKKRKLANGEIRSCCPAHKGDNPEAFSINISTHRWSCFSRGCKGTKLIDLYAQSTGLQFKDSAKYLAERFGIHIQYRDIEGRKEMNPVEYSHQNVIDCWEKASHSGNDTYFSKKGLTPPPIAKFGKNPKGYSATLIPLKNIEGTFCGLISLSDYGKLNFKAADTIKESFAQLGEIKPDCEFFIGEGIATVQTAWEASQRKIPAVSCGSWSNIEPVVSAIKTRYPNAVPIVLIDDDEGGNGEKAAIMVKDKYPDATFRKPSFEEFPNPNNEKITDFNDIISKCGSTIEEVKRQLGIEYPLKKKEIEAPNISTEKSKAQGRCENAGEVLKRSGFLDRIKNRMLEFKNTKEVKLSGISTSFKRLDEIIDGLQGGHLVIFAGRTGMGKTYAALNILKNTAIEQRIPSALYSLEMSNAQVFYRLTSLLSGIPATKIKRGTINDKELYQVEEAIRKIENSPLYVTDEPANSILTNLHTNMKIACEEKTRIIFLDHIGLVSCGPNSREARAVELGRISMTIKLTAKKYDVPIICLAQLNREAAEGGEPKLSQLRESGNLEQDADIVLFIHRRDYYDKNDKQGQVDIIIAKNREGEPGKVTFGYGKETWLIEELPPISEIHQIPNGHRYN